MHAQRLLLPLAYNLHTPGLRFSASRAAYTTQPPVACQSAASISASPAMTIKRVTHVIFDMVGIIIQLFGASTPFMLFEQAVSSCLLATTSAVHVLGLIGSVHL